MDVTEFYGSSATVRVIEDGNVSEDSDMSHDEEEEVAVAEALCKTGKSLSKKRGRPSNEIQKQLDSKKKRGPTADLPQRQVRQDGVDHMPIWLENRGRCKYPECKGKSYIACLKCSATLCLNKERNCFIKFHNE